MGQTSGSPLVTYKARPTASAPLCLSVALSLTAGCRVVRVEHRGCARLLGMATTRKTPIQNSRTTGKPSTPSGSGTVHPGRTGPRNGSKVSGQTRTSNTSNPSKQWWDNVNSGDNRTSDRMAMSAGLHRLADELFRPDLAPDADRPTGPRSRLPDQRLYETKAKTSTSTGRGRNGATSGSNGNARVAKATPTKATSRGRGK